MIFTQTGHFSKGLTVSSKASDREDQLTLTSYSDCWCVSEMCVGVLPPRHKPAWLVSLSNLFSVRRAFERTDLLLPFQDKCQSEKKKERVDYKYVIFEDTF